MGHRRVPSQRPPATLRGKSRVSACLPRAPAQDSQSWMPDQARGPSNSSHCLVPRTPRGLVNVPEEEEDDGLNVCFLRGPLLGPAIADVTSPLSIGTRHRDQGTPAGTTFHQVPESSPTRASMTTPTPGPGNDWRKGPTSGPVWGTALAPRPRSGSRAGCEPAWPLALLLQNQGNPVNTCGMARRGRRAKQGSLICGHQADQHGGGGGEGQGPGFLVVTEKMGIPVSPL